MLQKCLQNNCLNISLNTTYCLDHYREHNRDLPAAIVMPFCKSSGCKRFIYAKGLCKSHYDKRLKHGDENYIRKKYVDKGCKIKDCKNKHFGLGYCQVHYRVFDRDRKKKEIMEMSLQIQGEKDDFTLQALY